MLKRTEVRQAVLSYDVNKIKNEYPQLAFLMLASSDYYFVEGLVKNEISADNNPYVKSMQSLASYASAYGLQKAIELIPVVGDIIQIVGDLTGLNFGAFVDISDSGRARQRLNEWEYFIRDNYNVGELHNFSETNMHYTRVLFHARPKCTSPTTNCANEHKRYCARTHIFKESMQGLYNLLFNQLDNDSNFLVWQNQMQSLNKTNNNVTKTKTNLALPLLLGSLFLFKT